jgi:MATE family multidrug resistance protein
MFACAIMNWCVAGSLYLVAYVFGLPAHLAWIAVVAVYSTAPVLFWLRWKNGKWRRHILDV